MRLAAKRDRNEPEIIEALEAIGCVVYRVSQDGLPDLLTLHRGVWRPIEVKMPKGKLTPSQQRTYAQTPFAVVESVDDALKVFNVRGRR